MAAISCASVLFGHVCCSLALGVFLFSVPAMESSGWAAYAAPRKDGEQVAASASSSVTTFPVAVEPSGDALLAQVIWTARPEDEQGAFRKEFTVPSVPLLAPLRIFAATRYCLWVNGTYVLRGPARFECWAAEYDTVDIARYLRPGRNVLAVLVHRDRPTGRIRNVEPGLTVALDLGGGRQIRSDASWLAVREASFGSTGGEWSSIRDHRNAEAMPDWTPAEFNAAAWPKAVLTPKTAEKNWPHLVARRSALQRETAVPVSGITVNDVAAALPVALKPNERAHFTTARIIQAYVLIDCEAEAGTELSLTYKLLTYQPGALRDNGTDTYRCRAGRQTWMTDDTNALSAATLTVNKGTCRLLAVRLVEVLYPFDIAGAFACPDAMLTHLWSMMARGAQLLSEDAYVDCAERERVEWMECSPPMAQTTRVSMTTPEKKATLYSDARLLKAVLWRTAQTQRADGMVKAHTCSERWDIHAIMEDRSCDWIQLTREYFEHTNDRAFVQEIWPAIAKQLDAFLAKRTQRGLIQLREWVDWGNPFKYRVFEGTLLNAFMYASLVDGAFLAQAAGDTKNSKRYADAAQDLRRAIQTKLWDSQAGAMSAGLDEKDGRPIAANIHAATYALRWNVVDGAQRERLYQWLWSRREEVMKNHNEAMLFHHLFEVLYTQDDPAADAWVLEAMRNKWKAQVEAPMQVPGESLGVNEVIHCYSMFPVYFLSSYVLGVRLAGPVSNKALFIDPRLGGLPSAEGTVVTELGLVTVSWKSEGSGLQFAITIPAGATASVRLPTTGTTITVAGKSVQPTGLSHGRPLIRLTAGSHKGTVQ